MAHCPSPSRSASLNRGSPALCLLGKAVSPGEEPWSSGDRGFVCSPPAYPFGASPLGEARSQVWGSALATAVAWQLPSQVTVVLPLLQELLAVLHQEGPSTEGIFRRAASGTVLRELREALDGDVDVDLGSQPVLLLAVILNISASGLQLEELLAGLECSKAHLEPLALQDFLQSVPSKLLVTNLYAECMTAMKRTSKQEKGGRQVACSKSPRPQAATVPAPAYRRQCVRQQVELQQSGHRVGPKLLSPVNEDLLPLELLLEVPHKVNMLVELLIENCRKIFGEEMAGLSSPPVEELPVPMDRSTAAFGRAMWPCRRSRRGAPGKSLPGRTTLSAHPPESSRGRHSDGIGNSRGTCCFASSHPRDHSRLPGMRRRTQEPFRGKQVCRLPPGK
ncbi:uncharacterized protein ACIBXB_005173 [Morphnus guianensis]